MSKKNPTPVVPVTVASKPTPEEALQAWLETRLKVAEATKAKFLESFAKNSAYAMEWADDTFKAAADEKVLKPLLKCLVEKVRTVDEIKALVTERLISAASSGGRSTSECTNAMADAERRALASVVDYFHWRG